MRTLVVYDDEGYVLSISSGQPAPREPIGVPFLWADIPEGSRIKMSDGVGVDVTVTPHRLILGVVPPSEIDQLKQTVADLTEIVLSGGM